MAETITAIMLAAAGLGPSIAATASTTAGTPIGEMLTGIVAAAGLAGALCLWTVRQIIRDEIEPLKQDIAVLRGAVFNHLAHGEPPDEAQIRERLGYDGR